MQKLKNKKAFTLIEIVVVLIIVGVLAAIAIPSYFQWVTRSHAAEAAPTLSSLADQMDACLAKNNGSNCPVQVIGSSGSSSSGTITIGGSGGSGVFVGYSNVVNASPNFQYGIGSFMGGLNYYLIVANWDSNVNPGDPVSSQTVSCSNASHFSLTQMTYGMVGLCYDPTSKSRTLVSSGAFQGVF